MNPDQKRLILTLGLVMGILLFWSMMNPTLPPPQTPELSKSEVTPASSLREEPGLKAASDESPEKVDWSPVRLEIGKRTGSITGIEVGHDLLLGSANPGLLALYDGKAMLDLPARLENGPLLSQGTLQTAPIQVERRLSRHLDGHKNKLSAVYYFKNQTAQAQAATIRIALYRPLQVPKPQDAHFLMGTAKVGEKLERLPVKPEQPKRFATPAWVSAQEKSNGVIVRPAVPMGMFHVEQTADKQVVGWLEYALKLDPNEQQKLEFDLYIGPMSLSTLQEAGFGDALSFGAFSNVTRMLLKFLSWSNNWLHSYGLAICLLSFVVWLPFAPMTWYGMRASQQTMNKMSLVRPQEARIRQEHKNNPQKMNQEIMQLYRKHKVNPASGCIGCLPFIFTWPIYIALFQVLNRAPELREAAFLWIRDLSMPDALIRFPKPLPLLGEGLNVLPLLAAAATFFQQKLMPKPANPVSEEQRIQQQMAQLFPLMFAVLFYSLPSGFMLYWVVNSLLMACLQYLAMRSAHK